MDCESAEICEEFMDLISPNRSGLILSEIFNNSHAAYPWLADVFDNCRKDPTIPSYATDCSEHILRLTHLSYHMARLIPNQFKIERHAARLGETSALLPIAEPGSQAASEKDIVEDSKRRQINNVNIVTKKPIHSNFNSTVPSPRWLKVTNASLQGLCSILMALTSILTCLGR